MGNCFSSSSGANPAATASRGSSNPSPPSSPADASNYRGIPRSIPDKPLEEAPEQLQQQQQQSKASSEDELLLSAMYEDAFQPREPVLVDAVNEIHIQPKQSDGEILFQPANTSRTSSQGGENNGNEEIILNDRGNQELRPVAMDGPMEDIIFNDNNNQTEKVPEKEDLNYYVNSTNLESNDDVEFDVDYRIPSASRKDAATEEDKKVITVDNTVSDPTIPDEDALLEDMIVEMVVEESAMLGIDVDVDEEEEKKGLATTTAVSASTDDISLEDMIVRKSSESGPKEVAQPTERGALSASTDPDDSSLEDVVVGKKDDDSSIEDVVVNSPARADATAALEKDQKMPATAPVVTPLSTGSASVDGSTEEDRKMPAISASTTSIDSLPSNHSKPHGVRRSGSSGRKPIVSNLPRHSRRDRKEISWLRDTLSLASSAHSERRYSEDGSDLNDSHSFNSSQHNSQQGLQIPIRAASSPGTQKKPVVSHLQTIMASSVSSQSDVSSVEADEAAKAEMLGLVADGHEAEKEAPVMWITAPASSNEKPDHSSNSPIQTHAPSNLRTDLWDQDQKLSASQRLSPSISNTPTRSEGIHFGGAHNMAGSRPESPPRSLSRSRTESPRRGRGGSPSRSRGGSRSRSRSMAGSRRRRARSRSRSRTGMSRSHREERPRDRDMSPHSRYSVDHGRPDGYGERMHRSYDDGHRRSVSPPLYGDRPRSPGRGGRFPPRDRFGPRDRSPERYPPHPLDRSPERYPPDPQDRPYPHPQDRHYPHPQDRPYPHPQDRPYPHPQDRHHPQDRPQDRSIEGYPPHPPQERYGSRFGPGDDRLVPRDRSPPRHDDRHMPRERSPLGHDDRNMPRDRSPPRYDNRRMPRDRSPPRHWRTGDDRSHYGRRQDEGPNEWRRRGYGPAQYDYDHPQDDPRGPRDFRDRCIPNREGNSSYVSGKSSASGKSDLEIRSSHSQLHPDPREEDPYYQDRPPHHREDEPYHRGRGDGRSPNGGRGEDRSPHRGYPRDNPAYDREFPGPPPPHDGYRGHGYPPPREDPYNERPRGRPRLDGNIPPHDSRYGPPPPAPPTVSSPSRDTFKSNRSLDQGMLEEKIRASGLRPKGAADEPVSVEISPGVRVPLRRSAETMKAISVDFYQSILCVSCSVDIFSIADVSYVICPRCRVISPMTGDTFEGREIKRYGLGLGFTYESLFKMQSEIMQDRERNGKREDEDKIISSNYTYERRSRAPMKGPD